MTQQQRQPKVDRGKGPVQIGDDTFTASWEYRYTQVVLDGGVDGIREDNEWTITITLSDLGTAIPPSPPKKGQRTGLQVGKWPTAQVYLYQYAMQGSGIVMKFGTVEPV